MASREKGYKSEISLFNFLSISLHKARDLMLFQKFERQLIQIYCSSICGLIFDRAANAGAYLSLHFIAANVMIIFFYIFPL